MLTFTCVNLVSACTVSNVLQNDIAFITVCLAASLIGGNFLARLIIPSR